MADRAYELIELVGTAEADVSTAARTSIRRAAQTLQGLDWFAVQGMRGTIHAGEVGEFQVVLELGFRLMRPEELTR